MIRGILLTLLFFVLALQMLASLFETGVYVAEKIKLDKNDVDYPKNWLYYLKWVVKPASAGVALLFLLSAIFSCRYSVMNKAKSGNGKALASLLGIFSVIFIVAWTVIVVFQFRNTDRKLNDLYKDSVFSLGDGFTFKVECDDEPFVSLDGFGKVLCKLSKAESIGSIACLGLWVVALVFSFFLCCTAHKRKKPEEPKILPLYVKVN